MGFSIEVEKSTQSVHKETELSQDDLVMVKVDLTRQGGHNYDRLLRDYNVKGVPTVVFLDPSGKERTDLRLVEFTAPNEFLNRMVSLR